MKDGGSVGCWFVGCVATARGEGASDEGYRGEAVPERHLAHRVSEVEIRVGVGSRRPLRKCEIFVADQSGDVIGAAGMARGEDRLEVRVAGAGVDEGIEQGAVLPFVGGGEKDGCVSVEGLGELLRQGRSVGQVEAFEVDRQGDRSGGYAEIFEARGRVWILRGEEADGTKRGAGQTCKTLPSLGGAGCHAGGDEGDGDVICGTGGEAVWPEFVLQRQAEGDGLPSERSGDQPAKIERGCRHCGAWERPAGGKVAAGHCVCSDPEAVVGMPVEQRLGERPGGGEFPVAGAMEPDGWAFCRIGAQQTRFERCGIFVPAQDAPEEDQG